MTAKPNPKPSQNPPKGDMSPKWQPINLNAAGIDIGSDTHWVSVPPERDSHSVRRFGCFTADLYALADWLQACGIETVAMESTGVYWIPVFQILETRGPGSRITGGKVKSSQTRHVVNRAANAFRMAAQSLGKSRTALGAFYRRMRSRLGAPKAITATAHKLARLFYRLWTTGEAYTDPGVDYYEQRYQERLVNNLKKKAQSLGFDLVAQSPAAECVS